MSRMEGGRREGGMLTACDRGKEREERRSGEKGIISSNSSAAQRRRERGRCGESEQERERKEKMRFEED